MTCTADCSSAPRSLFVILHVFTAKLAMIFYNADNHDMAAKAMEAA